MSEECTGPFSDAKDCPVHSKDVKGRLYTESDLQLERAAIVREAHAVFQDEYCKHDEMAIGLIRGLKAILAIPTDQPALDRLDALAHAETAAMLEKAVDIRIDNEDGTTSRPAQIFRDRIRALISTSYADALKAKLEEARLEEAKCIPVQLWARSVDELKSLNMYRTMRIETLEKEIAAHRAARQAPEEK